MGSPWRLARNDDGSWRPLTYREAAEILPNYVADLGFTHVEFLPLAQYPFSGSWGYQVTGYANRTKAASQEKVSAAPGDWIPLLSAVRLTGGLLGGVEVTAQPKPCRGREPPVPKGP